MKTWTIALFGIALASAWVFLVRVVISWMDGVGVLQPDVLMSLVTALTTAYLAMKIPRNNPQTTTQSRRVSLYAIVLVVFTIGIMTGLYVASNGVREVFVRSKSVVYSVFFDGQFVGALLILGTTLLLCLLGVTANYRLNK